MQIRKILIVPVVCRRSEFFSKQSGTIYIAETTILFIYVLM